MSFLIAALALGFLGSFHCIGMCGPIALALPVHNKPPLLKYTLIVWYNMGRITTYSVFGILAGGVGKSFAMAGLQQALSIAIGMILLISVFLTFRNSYSGFGLFLWVKASLTRLFSKGSQSSLFTIGLLNGFLPCGLVYVGIAGAVATGDLVKGTLFMLTFGMGTAPMMFALPVIGSSISVSSKNKIRKAMPVAIFMMALLLIVRGLNLGIPYLSPQIQQNQVSCSHENKHDKKPVIKCHKPLSTQ